MVQVYIYILNYSLSKLLWSHLLDPSPVLKYFHEDSWMLRVHSSRLRRPCTYCKWCGLEYVLHFLLLIRSLGHGPNWYTKLTVFLKRYTVSQLLLIPLTPHLHLSREVIRTWLPSKLRRPSLLSSSNCSSAWPIGTCLLSSSYYHTKYLRRI